MGRMIKLTGVQVQRRISHAPHSEETIRHPRPALVPHAQISSVQTMETGTSLVLFSHDGQHTSLIVTETRDEIAALIEQAENADHFNAATTQLAACIGT